MESSEKLEKYYFKEGSNESLKAKLDLRKVNETKDAKKTIILCQECYLKYITIRAMQRNHRETCGQVIKYLQYIEKLMADYYKLKILSGLVVLSKTQAHKGPKLQAITRVTKKKGKIVELEVKDREGSVVAEDSASQYAVKRLNSTLALADKEVSYDARVKIFLISPKINAVLGGGCSEK